MKLNGERLKLYLIKHYGASPEEFSAFNWRTVSHDENIPETFLEEYQHKVDWKMISEYQMVSDEFLIKFKDRIDWIVRLNKYQVSVSVLKAAAEHLNWKHVSGVQILTEDEMEELKDYIDWEVFSSERVLKNLPLSPEFIERNKNRLDMYVVSRFNDLTEEILEEFEEVVDWPSIFMYQALPEKVLRKYIHRLVTPELWRSISHHPLSESFIIDYQDKVSWDMVSYYSQLSYAFILKHIDRLDVFKLTKNKAVMENLTTEQRKELENMVDIKKKF